MPTTERPSASARPTSSLPTETLSRRRCEPSRAKHVQRRPKALPKKFSTTSTQADEGTETTSANGAGSRSSRRTSGVAAATIAAATSARRGVVATGSSGSCAGPWSWLLPSIASSDGRSKSGWSAAASACLVRRALDGDDHVVWVLKDVFEVLDLVIRIPIFD